jgi:hypothetical protein
MLHSDMWPLVKSAQALQARGIYASKDRQVLLATALHAPATQFDTSEPMSKQQTPAVARIATHESAARCEAATLQESSTTACAPAQHRESNRATAQSDALPGIQTLWDLSDVSNMRTQSRATASVSHVSRRLAALAALIGVHACAHDGTPQVSVANMLVREPQLLHADMDSMAQRLLDLRLKLSGRLDVAKLLEQQPSLLMGSKGSEGCVSRAVAVRVG